MAKAPATGKMVAISKTCQVCGETVDIRVVYVRPMDISDAFRAKCQGELITIISNPWMPPGQTMMPNMDLLGSHGCPGPRPGRAASPPDGPAAPPGSATERLGGAGAA